MIREADYSEWDRSLPFRLDAVHQDLRTIECASFRSDPNTSSGPVFGGRPHPPPGDAGEPEEEPPHGHGRGLGGEVAHIIHWMSRGKT